mgnify:CR=1 FL=1|tara:strand:+ start:266 stop:1837 length:1572 start_codon:yes stop_codon:yes gene_type:complete
MEAHNLLDASAPTVSPSGADSGMAYDNHLGSALLSLEDQEAHSNPQCINNAALMLSLCGMCGVPGVASEECDEFSSFICRLMCGEVACTYEDGTSDAAIIRAFVESVCGVLEAAIHPTTLDDKGILSSNLNMAMTDLMRTAAFCLISGDIDARKEYTRERRSPESQKNGELWQLVRGPSITAESRMAYATAEAMADNFENGVEALSALALWSDDELLNFVNMSIRHLVRHLECISVPILFDGQRLFAGITIATKLFGNDKNHYGTDFMAQHVLNANSTSISLFRIQATFCAFLAMAKNYITGDDDDAAASDLLQIIEDFVIDMDKALKSKIKEDSSRRDSPGSITAIFACIAKWFEMAMHDDMAYRVVQSAFQSPVLVLGEACLDITNRWNDFCLQNEVSEVNLWTAVQFVITSRKEMYGTSMPISNAVHVVLSGLVGNCVSPAEINGKQFVSNHQELPHLLTFPCISFHSLCVLSACVCLCLFASLCASTASRSLHPVQELLYTNCSLLQKVAQGQVHSSHA